MNRGSMCKCNAPTPLNQNKNKSGTWGYQKLLFCIGMLLTVLQQYPIVRDVAYGEIRIVLYCLFGGISLYLIFHLSFKKTPSLARWFFVSIALTLIFFLLLQIADGGAFFIVNYMDIVELLIPFGILVSSISLHFNRKQLVIVVFIYALMATLMGVLVVSYYGGSWVISARYIMDEKNQIGPILSTSFVALLCIIYREKKQINTLLAFLSCVMICILFVSMLIIRNRSGLLAVFVVLFLILARYLLENKKKKEYVVIMLIAIGLFLMATTGNLFRITKPIQDAFTLNYQIGDLESLSAGRTSVYSSSFRYLMEHLAWGEFFSLDKFPSIPHNYLLNKWVKYGIIGSFPMVAFYLYLWFFVIKILFHPAVSSVSFISMVSLLFLIPMITSMFEYSHPYGPGVSQLMVWFMLGQYLRTETVRGSTLSEVNWKRKSRF